MWRPKEKTGSIHSHIHILFDWHLQTNIKLTLKGKVTIQVNRATLIIFFISFVAQSTLSFDQDNTGHLLITFDCLWQQTSRFANTNRKEVIFCMIITYVVQSIYLQITSDIQLWFKLIYASKRNKAALNVRKWERRDDSS